MAYNQRFYDAHHEGTMKDLWDISTVCYTAEQSKDDETRRQLLSVSCKLIETLVQRLDRVETLRQEQLYNRVDWSS